MAVPLDRLGQCRSVLLETRKRDGTWVPTLVSLAVDNGRAYFRTYDVSGKAKRLRNFDEVRVAPSKRSGDRAGGRAGLLDGADAVRAAELLARKHPILQRRLVPWLHRRRGWTTLHYELTLKRELTRGRRAAHA